MVAGWVIGRLKLEHLIEDWGRELRAAEAVAVAEKLTWSDRIEQGREAVRDIVGKVWIYVRPFWPFQSEMARQLLKTLDEVTVRLPRKISIEEIKQQKETA